MIRVQGGRHAKHTATFVTKRLEVGKIGGAVNTCGFGCIGRCCIALIQRFHQSRHLYQVAHPAF